MTSGYQRRPLTEVEQELDRVKRKLAQVQQEVGFPVSRVSRLDFDCEPCLLHRGSQYCALEYREAMQEITEYIEIFFNRQRRQKRLDYLSPAADERKYFKELRAAEEFGVRY